MNGQWEGVPEDLTNPSAKEKLQEKEIVPPPQVPDQNELAKFLDGML